MSETGTGKTSLAAQVAVLGQFKFVKVIFFLSYSYKTVVNCINLTGTNSHVNSWSTRNTEG